MTSVDQIMKECPRKAKDDYKTINRGMGCKPGGFGTECKNCVALGTAIKLAAKDEEFAKLYAKTINGNQWSGKIVKNPGWLNHFSYNPSKNKKEYVVTYQGDVALWTPPMIADAYRLALDAPKHKFTFLSKLPFMLWKKTKICIDMLKAEGIDIYKAKNIKFGTSVGINSVQYRIDQLRRFEGFPLEVWHKPVLENIDHPNYYGIHTIRVNAEKGWHKRSWNPDHILNIIKEAKNQGVRVCFDMNRDILNKKNIAQTMANNVGGK